jgi:predicted component of type VI protein secretion system
MQVKLHLVKGNPQGKQVEVPLGTLTIGRAEDSDLIIASTRVSRHHCEIINEENRVRVRDKGSGNGTLVNGERVAELVLNPGDEVQIGPLTFAVEIDGNRERIGAPAAKPAAPTRPVAAQAKAGPSLKAAPKPLAKPAPRPAGRPAAPAMGGGRRNPNDILASLERLAGAKKPDAKPPARGAKKSDDVIKISDEDLLDTDK